MMDRSLLRAAIVAFVASRVLVFALLVAGSQIAFLGKVYSGTVWETRIDLASERVRPELERVAMAGDSWWYRSIARAGYDGKTKNVAFFPLPMTESLFLMLSLGSILAAHRGLWLPAGLLGGLAAATRFPGILLLLPLLLMAGRSRRAG